MILDFVPMNKQAACTITTWRYSPSYECYNMDTRGMMEELLNGDYYQAIDTVGEVLGFICFRASAQVRGGFAAGAYADDSYLDLGLGLRPDLTGTGLGYCFLTQALKFARKQFGSCGIRLSVATFNQRAIKVYQKAGFKAVKTFISSTPSGEREFVYMHLDITE